MLHRPWDFPGKNTGVGCHILLQRILSELWCKYVVVQSLSHVWLFVTPGTAAHQASLTFTSSWSLLKLMSIESMMPSYHFILCRPLLLLPSVFPSIRVFSNESTLHIRWPKYQSFSLSISPLNFVKLSFWCVCDEEQVPHANQWGHERRVAGPVWLCVCVCVHTCAILSSYYISEFFS